MMKHNLFIYKCLVVAFLLGCWSCYDDSIESFSEKGFVSDKLTVEEAHAMFVRYYMNCSAARSLDGSTSSVPLDPGMLTPDWEEANLSSNEVNSYVNVPVLTGKRHYVKSPYNETRVEVSQKLVAVQDDASQRKNLYILSVIPEGIFAYKQANAYIHHCNGAEIPKRFSGLLVYTKPEGGIPVYMAHYVNGSLTREVFLFDKTNSLQENIATINEMLSGYSYASVREQNSSLSRAEGWGSDNDGCGCCSGCTSNGEAGSCACPCEGCAGSVWNDWQFNPTGDPYENEYGDTCWDATDSNGNEYTMADMDGDGIPETMLGDETTVTPGGGEEPTDPENPFPDEGDEDWFPDEGGETPGGDVNPGSGGVVGGGGGSGDSEVPTEDYTIYKGVNLCNNIQSDMKNDIKRIIDILNELGIPNNILSQVYVKMGSPTFGNAAEVVTSGEPLDRVYGDTPLNVILNRDPMVSETGVSLAVAHEFYHVYLYGLSRKAGSALNLSTTNPDLHSLLNNYPVNDAHHNYIGDNIVAYEDYLRKAYPNQSNDFYVYGKWGGGIDGSPAFQNLPRQEQIEIYNYLQSNVFTK